MISKCMQCVVVLSVLFLGAALVCAEEKADASSQTVKVSVPGFDVEYTAVPTPEAQWDDGSVEVWLQAFRGHITSKKPLGYRGRVLPAGRHQMWVEKGKKEWFYLMIGNKNDSDKPRLKALFKLYELEKGVEAVRFQPKLISHATKLKFSILAGKNEGHGNIRILEEAGDGDGKGEDGESEDSSPPDRDAASDAA